MENHPGPENTSQKWGTWEELLLACAVKRHGSKDWDAVAMEVQTRTTLPNLLTTAHCCEQKFLDLKRRFAAQRNEDIPETLAGDNVDHVPWLEELKKLRIAELQKEVQRSDISILSLQLKVKRLEEERVKSLKENIGEGKEEEKKPDLTNSGEPKPLNDKKGGQEKAHEPETRLEDDHNSKQPTGDESDRENQSVNESNSTVSVGKTGDGEVKLETAPVHDGPKEPDAFERKAKPVGEESNNGSYDAAAKVRESQPPGGEMKVEDSSELRDSVTHSRDGGEGGTRDSSEVQSSASLTRKRKTRRRKEQEEPPENDEVAVKSHPLIGVLDLIKGHDNSTLFGRRLQSQDSDKYKKIVRQHMDLEAIQRRLRNGTYSRCTQAFFRDLLLLFTNATVFFPTDSVESRTAQRLRRLVSNEIKHHIPTPGSHPLPRNTDLLPPNPSSSKPKPDSLLSKHKASAPILVCRKRSSISAKPSSSSAAFGHKGDLPGHEKKPASDTEPPSKPSSSDTDEEPPKKKEKPITGVRSLRRSNKSISGNPSKKTGTTSKPPESTKSDKIKAEGSGGTAATDKKRSAAVDFLRRIKRNAPTETLKSGGASGGSSSKGGGVSGKDPKKKMNNGKGDKGKERSLRYGGSGGGGGSSERKNENDNSSQSKRSVGRPPKKVAETSNAVSAKRARESGGGKDKRPKKRSKK